MNCRVKRVGVALLAVLTAPACSQVSYIGHLGYNEARILLARRNVEKVLEDSNVPGAEKAKIRLILEAKEFALAIGLARTENFRAYTKLDRDWTSLALTAAPPESLDPHEWCFPIVGRVPYKGFFDPARATAEKKALEEKGYETYLRKVVAFSTLGWFDDPILSPMLRMDDVDLVDTVIHETTHATIFLKGQADFNESLATFIGEAGSLAFLQKKFGDGSPEVAGVCDLNADEARFSEFLHRLVDKLQDVYHSAVSRDDKLERKGHIYSEMKRELREDRGNYRTDRFVRFADLDWNNAMLASFRGYRRDLDLFRALYRHEGYDLPRTISTLKRIGEGTKGKAFDTLRRFLEQDGADRPSETTPPCAALYDSQDAGRGPEGSAPRNDAS